jgi:2-desacetyl-2-hydroxyethyl bacteriochlorophyllide A dehydrogenase
MCSNGQINLCENLRFFGCVHDQGGMADYFTIPANRVHVIPDDLTDLQAVLIEPLSTPVHAVKLSGGVQDQAVVIIGAGTIGLLVLAAARHAGARRIVMTDILQSKRARALRLGADAVVDAAAHDATAQIRTELGESADVVFDCVAIQPTVDQAVQLALKGGVVMIVGVPARPVTVPLPEIQDLQVRIQGSATYLPEDYATATEIIQAGKVRVEDIITARFPLDQAATAFSSAAGGEEVKVVLLADPAPQQH